VEDKFLFFIFSAFFISYFYLISRPRKAISKLRALHRLAGLTVSGSQHVYVGNLNQNTAVDTVKGLLGSYITNHHFEVYESIDKSSEINNSYAIINVNETDDVQKMLKYLAKQYRCLDPNLIHMSDNTIIRQYIIRNTKNDRRANFYLNKYSSRRKYDRRCSNFKLVYDSNCGGSENNLPIANSATA
jgi:hypothetical protein